MDFRRYFYFHYLWLIGLLQAMLIWVPPIFRNLIYKLVLKKMGKNVFIDNGVYFRFPSRIRLGSNVSINRACSFYASYYFKNVEIVIGNNVRIGPNVSFFTAGHDMREIHLPNNAESIHVGDNVWIGGNVSILQGVYIGEGAVIGAGSVLTSNVPAFKVYAGNPAKELKDRNLVEIKNAK